MIINLDIDHVDISVEVLNWFNEVESVIQESTRTSHTGIPENDRMAYVSKLGKVYEDYRNEIYSNGFSTFEKIIFRKS